MPLSPDTEALMLAYVYGELDGDAARAFEARLAEDAELRAEVEGLMATRDLLQVDARYGDESGLDAPPPHLVDAILSAEALARPPEIRDASLAVRGRPEEPRGWVQKLSSWLLGGGVVVTAAAALLLMVSRKDAEEAPPMAAAEAPAPKQAEAQLAREAAERTEADRAVDDKAAPPPPGVEPEPAGDEKPSAAPEIAQAAKAEEKRAAKLDDLLARPVVEEDAPAKDAKRAGRAKRKVRPAPVEKSPARTRAAPAKGGALKEALEPPPRDDALDRPMAAGDAEPQAADETDALSGGASPPGRGASPEGGTRGSAALAPPQEQPEPSSAPPSSLSVGGAYGSGPPSLPDVVKKQAAERRKARSRTQAGAKADSLKRETERARAQMEAETALASGGVALSEGRADEALELFQRAALFDKVARVLGAAPYVGQMRAYLALQRPREALALHPLVRRYATTAEDRAQGALSAGQAAEALGQNQQARRLYEEAARHKSTKAAALKGLERLREAAAALESAAEAPPPASTEAR